MDQTVRFALPFLAPGQFQKELHVNEGLQRIDILLCAMVEGPPTDDPPAGPSAGQAYLVGEAPTGDWIGNSGAIAGFTDGGWRFVAPPEGARVLDRVTGEPIVRRNGAWEAGVVRAREIRVDGQRVLGEQQPPVAEPVGGSFVDLEARTAISTIIASLRSHGLIGG
jgi:hypothetical protein